MKKQILSLLTCTSLILGGCSVSAAGNSLNAGSFQPPESLTLTSQQQTALADFSLNLLRQSTSLHPENPLLSPASVFLALGMTMDGADGQTLSEFESVFHMDRAAMNQTAGVLTAMAEDDSGIFTGGNSIWVLDSLQEDLNKDWLSECRTNFDADVFASAMDDETRKAINDWVSKKTDGQIPELLREFPPGTVMTLVNALCFDGKWEDPFEESSTWPQTFTNAGVSQTDTDMMHGNAEYYFSQNDWKGCVKTFQNGQYGFMALLPPEDMAWKTALDSLSGQQLVAMLSSAKEIHTVFALPKMDLDVSSSLVPVLSAMGLESPFEPGADFSNMTNGANAFSISEVIHAAKLKVDEAGAKAAAATAVLITESASMIEYEVICDRPYVYAIVDMTSHIPLFLGVQSTF